jgi:hypothetical protein
MINRSREVQCPKCSGSNFWKGDPHPDQALHCRYCQVFIMTYDDYIRGFIRKEAERLIAEFAGGVPSSGLEFLDGKPNSKDRLPRY